MTNNSCCLVWVASAVVEQLILCIGKHFSCHSKSFLVTGTGSVQDSGRIIGLVMSFMVRRASVRCLLMACIFLQDLVIKGCWLCEVVACV